LAMLSVFGFFLSVTSAMLTAVSAEFRQI